MTPYGTDNPSPEVMFSLEALHRAWRSVRRNGSTPGSDRVTILYFEQHLEAELARLRTDILAGRYRPQPVLRYYKLKESGKNRPLSLWSLRDRIAQRGVHEYLTPILERRFLECSYGFRPGRSIEQAVEAIVQARESNFRWVVDADITQCFDSIPFDLLMHQASSMIPSELAVQLIRLWLQTPIKHHLGEKAGVSQGSVISPQLANLYLHRFDEMVLAALPQAKLIRFADDFVLLCRHRSEANWSLTVAKRCLGSLRLRLNMDKTRIVHFEEGFTFLGVAFKGRKYTLPNS